MIGSLADGSLGQLTFCSGQEVLVPEIDERNQQNGLDPEEAIIMERW